MTTLTATDARKGFFDLLKRTNDQHEIYHIHHRSGDAVLMSEEEYDSLTESLALLSSPGFRENFEKSRREEADAETVGFEDVFGEAQ
ncbi:MAG: type II toxin-antitoxin system Phd/YefM family antitoxin [Verrucomicrobia bacterium]|jgi:antitoxin YefM|nr:type II toxin-antitoxin system Phd/YefM family antitoxin [Verrucomicrobiota bacterium]